jgi:hypothetical protein
LCGRRMYGSEGQRVGGVPASYTNADWGSLSLWAFGAPRFTLVVLATWGLADSGGANILAR